ncbi:MAG: hypothetical protein Q8831_02505 ['Bonamia sp.' little leaf phytoplasma]|nr:hypothetical protein ['Bonamia sp.' little leaf phytoplasma]
MQDRIIQKALEQLLTPYFENIFSEWSFGFRPKQSGLDAIKRIKQRFKGLTTCLKLTLKVFEHPLIMISP